MNLATAEFDSDYDRERLAPEPGDPFFIHLSDLRTALTESLTGAKGRWLDYGAGSSPYRRLLAGVDLKRADFAGSPEVDYLLVPGEACPAAADSFDGILSTQVLEHVDDVGFYLRDCWRMLRPGGQLVLTTHGMWEEHASPADFRRWTIDGIVADMAPARLRVLRVGRLSVGLRGLLQLMLQQRHLFHSDRRSLPGASLWVLGKLLWSFRYVLARFADRRLPDQRVLWGTGNAYRCGVSVATLYLGVIVIAEKPLS